MTNVMRQLGLSLSPQPVVTAWISTDAHYAFVEFRTIEETLAAITHLNGMQVGAHALKIGRPKGYNPATAPVVTGTIPGLGLSMSAATVGGANSGGLGGGLASAPIVVPQTTGGVGSAGVSDVLMVSNLPGSIAEQHVRELVSTFGQVICAIISVI